MSRINDGEAHNHRSGGVMKIRVLVLLIVLTIVPTISFCLTRTQKHNASTSPLVGVWRLSEIAPGSSNPQPGIYIFTDHYFSHDAVSSDTPRSLLARDRALTDREIADAARGFLGSAGIYDVKGDQITMRVIAALNPNYMLPEYSRVYSFRFVGRDTLWITETEAAGKPIPNPPMLKLTRLE